MFIIMKKILLSAFFALFMCCTVSADQIKVTLSNGQVVILDSDDYKTMDELWRAIEEMEKNISSTITPTAPITPSVPKNP